MDATERDRDLTVGAIDWLTQLPLLGVEELSLLLQARADPVSRALSELERLGRVEWVAPESPEVAGRRLYFPINEVSDTAVSQGNTEDRKEILVRLARLEMTVALNRFFVEAAAAASRDVDIDLVTARSLPSAACYEDRWWPPEIEGYGCLRWGSWWAPFFVAWDRAGAPHLHRRIRVSGWYAFGESRTSWGGQLPPILVVCPGERQIKRWAQLAIASADRRGVAPLPLALATSANAWREPLGTIWRRVDGTLQAPLRDRVRWDLRLPSQAEPVVPNPGPPFQGVERSRSPLRDWARALAEDERPRSSLTEVERVGVLALVANGDHKTLLEWIGHHPLLSPTDLSVLLNMPAALVNRLLGRLSDWRLVDALVRAANGKDAPLPRYFLRGEGLRLLAARDGVPWQRYFRHGVLAAPAEGKRQRDRLKGFLAQFEHTVGVNSFFVRLAASPPASGRLLRWLNAAESTERYGYGGKTLLLRPDACGIVATEKQVCHFFLEWDRGTMRGSQMREKFHYYAAYFASRQSTSDGGPAVLIVTKSPHRENVIWDDLEKAFDDVNAKPSRFFTSIDTLIGGPGPFAPIWRSLRSSRRTIWPGASMAIAFDPSAGDGTAEELRT